MKKNNKVSFLTGMSPRLWPRHFRQYFRWKFCPRPDLRRGWWSRPRHKTAMNHYFTLCQPCHYCAKITELNTSFKTHISHLRRLHFLHHLSPRGLLSVRKFLVRRLLPAPPAGPRASQGWRRFWPAIRAGDDTLANSLSCTRV